MPVMSSEPRELVARGKDSPHRRRNMWGCRGWDGHTQPLTTWGLKLRPVKWGLGGREKSATDFVGWIYLYLRLALFLDFECMLVNEFSILSELSVVRFCILSDVGIGTRSECWMWPTLKCAMTVHKGCGERKKVQCWSVLAILYSLQSDPQERDKVRLKLPGSNQESWESINLETCEWENPISLRYAHVRWYSIRR